MCRREDYEHLGSGIDWDAYRAAPKEPEGGRQVYIDTADELSGDPTFVDQHMDPAARSTGEAYAAFMGLPWPPYPDVDIVLDVVKAAERRLQREE